MVNQVLEELTAAIAAGEFKKASALCQLLGMHLQYQVQFVQE